MWPKSGVLYLDPLKISCFLVATRGILEIVVIGGDLGDLPPGGVKPSQPKKPSFAIEASAKLG